MKAWGRHFGGALLAIGLLALLTLPLSGYKSSYDIERMLNNGTNGQLLIGRTAGDPAMATLTAGSGISITNGAGSVTIASTAVQGTTGGWSIREYEATTGALSGASGSCAVNVPSGAKLVGTQLRVDTAITSGDGGTTWGAIYATGATATIAANTTAFAKNTKVLTWFNENAATAITTGTTTITVAPNSGTFSGGNVRCITYAMVFIAMADAP